MPYSKEPVMEWNTIEANKAIVEDFAEANEISFEEAEKAILEDYDLWQSEYDFLTVDLTETMNHIQLNVLGEALGGYGKWIAEAQNMGWRHTSGTAHVEANNGKELLSKILPQTDNAFRIYDDGDSIRIINYHHDAPAGESYSISPITQSEFEYNYDFGELAKKVWKLLEEINAVVVHYGWHNVKEDYYRNLLTEAGKSPSFEGPYWPLQEQYMDGIVKWLITSAVGYVDGFRLSSRGGEIRKGYEDFFDDFRHKINE